MTRAALTIALACLASAGMASASGAAEIASFTARTSSTQAGAHADSELAFSFVTETGSVPGNGPFNPCLTVTGECLVVAGGAAKDLVVELPRGLVGSVNNIARCTTDELMTAVCPPASQVGIANLTLLTGGSVGAVLPVQRRGIFNVVPQRGEVARLALNVQTVLVMISLRLRPGGDGLVATTDSVSTGWPVVATEMTIWGVPGDSVHDAAGERVCPNNNLNFGCAFGAPPVPRPFLTNPPECGVEGSVTLRVNTYQDPDAWEVATSDPQQMEGCERQSFKPTLELRPTRTQRGQPTGLDVELSVPDTYDSPTSLATPPLRDAIVTLPQGTSISPSSADGLQACSDADLNLDNDQRVRCPNASKIGEVEVVTPLIADLLRGGIYLRPQASDDPTSGQMFRIAFEIANQDRGLNLKIPGEIALDPATGQITTRFTDNPQLAFESLRMRFKSGPRAPLALPTTCGVHTSRAVLTGWGVEDRPVTIESPFTVTHDGSGAPCPRGFSPDFLAGTTDPVAGKNSSFSLTFGRDDDDQELSAVKVDMPKGLLGYISDPVLCSDAQAAAGTCSEASRIGDVTTGAGPGTQPFFLPGRVYVTEGYKGAPFGLSIVVPAKAGPFDLGTVVVRSALYVDRHTAQLTVVSDPLPTILKGVLLHVRTVNVHINRPGFMVNPTSCEEMKFGGQIHSAEGAMVDIWNLAKNRFQVGDCAALDLKPKFAVRVGGRNRTQRGRSTPLRTKLRMPRGGANLRSVRVTLPTALNARLTVINDACTREQYDSGSDECEFARTGSAVAVTPLLRDPLRGGVYFVRNGNPLPDLFVRLRGQVDFDLIGRITIPGSKRLRTTFDMVPDVPVSMFALRLVAGRDGSVGNAANLCSRRARRARAVLEFQGQNGKELTQRKRLRVGGCRRGAGARGSRKGGRR